MKKNNLTETQVMRKLINEMNISKNECTLTDTDKLMEYLWVKPNVSGINVDLFIDDSDSYKRYNHQLLLYARNGYDKTFSKFIPISIEEHPRVLDNVMDFNISYDDIFLIQDFIQENFTNIIMLSNGSISHDYFISNVKKVTHENFSLVVEANNLLIEMATLRTNDSHLPVDIWLDEGSTCQSHAPRIKFRASNEQRTTREFSSMLLTNPPSIENMPLNSPIRKKDIDILKQFIVDNLELLLKLANGKIDYTKDFLPNAKFPNLT